MVCIYCGGKVKTNNSRRRKNSNSVWRRRECISCSAVFTSVEQLDLAGALRFHGQSQLEPFSRQKLAASLLFSLSHRKTALSDSGELSNTVIVRLLPRSSGIIERDLLITSVIDVLKKFDKVAATHYAAHHT